MTGLIRRVALSLPLSLALLAVGVSLVVVALATQGEPPAQANVGPTSHHVAADAAERPGSAQAAREGLRNQMQGAAQP